MRTRFCTALALLLVCLVARAAPAAEKPTHSLTATWPLPDDGEFGRQYTALAKRHGFTLPPGYAEQIREKSLARTPDGSPADPTYEVSLPPAYEPGRPVGLLVWIGAGESGRVPREDWKRVLAKHNLIWVGPNHVGNDRDTLWRTYMALEAVRQARLHYTIDDKRVYVAGHSGGGRIASHAALVGADAFTGGFYFVGCDFWRDVPVTPGDRRGKHFRGFWRKPDADLLRTARAHRYVLLTGTDDFNRVNTHAVYAGYRTAKFPHVLLLDVPGMGHTSPDAEWFEKGIAFLGARAPDAKTPTTRPTTRPATQPARRPAGLRPDARRVR